MPLQRYHAQQQLAELGLQALHCPLPTLLPAGPPHLQSWRPTAFSTLVARRCPHTPSVEGRSGLSLSCLPHLQGRPLRIATALGDIASAIRVPTPTGNLPHLCQPHSAIRSSRALWSARRSRLRLAAGWACRCPSHPKKELERDTESLRHTDRMEQPPTHTVLFLRHRVLLCRGLIPACLAWQLEGWPQA